MLRLFFTVFVVITLALPCPVLADSALAQLEAASRQDDHLQNGLESYQATVETSRIEEMIQQMTSNMPANLPRPEPPAITKYWQRGTIRSVIVAEQEQTAPYVSQMIEHFSSNLAVELEGMLMPADKVAERETLAKKADIKSTEVALADSTLQRFEITFAEPTDLESAFYTVGMRLPQKQVTALTFDVDTKTSTISEMKILTAEGLNLTSEIRYREVSGGWVPERIQTTSPDGSIEDLIEVTFVEVDGYNLPATMTRTLRRPNLQDNLSVSFTNYRINQPLPEAIRARMSTPE